MASSVFFVVGFALLFIISYLSKKKKILAVETVFALDMPTALKRDPLYSSSGVGALSLILGALGADPVVYEGKGVYGPLLMAGLRGTNSSGARDSKANNTADIIIEAADAVPDVTAIGLIADPGAISDFLSTALQISLYQQGSAHPSSVPFRSENGVSFLGFGGGDFPLIRLVARSVKSILGMSSITMKALSRRLLCRSKDEDLSVSSLFLDTDSTSPQTTKNNTGGQGPRKPEKRTAPPLKLGEGQQPAQNTSTC